MLHNAKHDYVASVQVELISLMHLHIKWRIETYQIPVEVPIGKTTTSSKQRRMQLILQKKCLQTLWNLHKMPMMVPSGYIVTAFERN